ncbi:MAG TPA: malectin, partial [Steroidobacteraceae bacterium]|nr:malectin [Steroidobacteraceae bacterium]
QDAVVRVEAHRLRKKLREIYEKDRSAIQISLPAGTYVPKFVLASEVQPAHLEPDRGAADAAGAGSLSAPGNLPRVERPTGRIVSAAAIIIVVIAVVLGFVLNARSKHEPASSRVQSQAQPASAPTGNAIDELHLMAGYSGSEVIDSSGVRWTPDTYFDGGGPWPRNGGFVRATSRPFLFANWRSGQFGYDIPLQPGTYELRLFFISPFPAGEEKLASFGVTLNGQPLLSTFDVNISANGPDTADEKVFRDISPGADGYLRLRFSNEVTTPTLSGLEITRGESGKLQPIRIITQPNSFVDHKGQRWRADDYYINGIRGIDHRKVSGTEDPELFGAERYGHFSYVIPVDTRGRYTVVLHFAEFYFGPQLAGGGGPGSRVFHVFCNGQTLLQDFDIYKEAGSLRVVTKTFTGIKPSAQGKINLTFEPVVNNATISAIEVLDESR